MKVALRTWIGEKHREDGDEVERRRVVRFGVRAMVEGILAIVEDEAQRREELTSSPRVLRFCSL